MLNSFFFLSAYVIVKELLNPSQRAAMIFTPHSKSAAIVNLFICTAKRKLWIPLCGGIVLEEALDLSSDRLLNNNNNSKENINLLATEFFSNFSTPCI